MNAKYLNVLGVLSAPLFPAMWQANKSAIITLFLGLALLSGVYHHLAATDIELAKKVLSVGFCALLFSVGLYALLTARR